MQVRDVMERIVVSVSPDTSYRDAALMMCTHNFSSLPVVNSDGQLVGVVSEKDLFRAVYPQYEEFARNTEAFPDEEAEEDRVEEISDTPISDYMVNEVITVDADAPILKAGGLMLAHAIHRMPVLENGRMVGIVSREDVYGSIIRRHIGI